MRVKQAGRIEGGAAGAGGVPLPYAPGISAALAVGFKLVNRIEGGAAEAGGVPLFSIYFPLLILAQYFHFWCRAIVVQITWGY
ncbi:hypothetical protein [Sansalvadorimonas verongulae]|uniref:hypothetical protein n=1 Tax=Sansalvadorimonas verongulae TaxID=2172824 RepID=UPI0012BD73FE|nr:hypothetical protein [Sansalvadorimonas verongulae]MTI11701.1 hypothetical protein [Sansalvadorimonas verongulae]